MRKLYNDFKTSLKDTAVEEIVDLFIFRPIAFVVVKLIYRLPVTPNQLSFLSIIAGIAAGVYYAMGDERSFFYAGILYALSHVLDCCDGMVARLKKNGTLIGRIIDGWADYITSVAVYVGLLIGLHNGSFQLGFSPWVLMAPASFSLFIHCMMVDYYRHEFMAHALGKNQSVREDMKFFVGELERLNKEKGRYVEKIMIIFYLGYTKLQLKENGPKQKYTPGRYYESNRVLLMLWNWIGATHIAVLVLASLLYNPMIFFYYIIGLANVWMLALAFIQVKPTEGLPSKTSPSLQSRNTSLLPGTF
jgi:phosphatidylglycerophosphate synthase